MSVWCTWLDLEHPEQTKADLAEYGIAFGVIGDDSSERELGSPYIYQGSHVVPRDGDPRGGSLDIAAVPNFLHPDAEREQDDDRFPVDFLRLCLDEDSSTYHYEHDQGSATVVLNRLQVTELRDVLTRWLDAEVRW